MELIIMIKDNELERKQIPDFEDYDLKTRVNLKEACVAMEIQKAKAVLKGSMITGIVWFMLAAESSMNQITNP